MARDERGMLRDATGAVREYRPVTAEGRIPPHPHPNAWHKAHRSGSGLHPNRHRPIADYLAWCADNDTEPDNPVDGDETARLARRKCWDDIVTRAPQRGGYTGTEPCDEPTCPHPRPHSAGQWFTDDWPTFGDIAHALYPGGLRPVPVDDAPPAVDDDDSPRQHTPVQLDLFADL